MKKESHPGEKIRQLREGQQLSVEELSQRSQCSAEFIQQLEAGHLAPSLAPLMKIARGLGMRLGTFLDDKSISGAVLVRRDSAEEVLRFSGGGARDKSALEFYSLAVDKQDRHMEPFVVDVHPIMEETSVLSSHEGEEFIYVLKGAIRVRYGKDSYLLHEGDSIYYDSVVPHEVRSEGDEESRILAVVYAPY